MVKQVEIFQREGDVLLFGKIANSVQCVPGFEPHAAGDQIMLPNGNATIAETGAVQVEPVDTEAFANGYGFAGRLEQQIGAIGISQTPLEIAVLDGVIRADLFQRIEVVVGPVS